MGLSWVACEARTGRLIERLPDMECRRVGVTLCRYEAAEGLSLPLPTAPPAWERAIMPGASFLVATDDDVPQWGGLVLSAPRTPGDRVEITAASVEVYAARRYVGDETYAGVPQNLIVKDLAEKYLAAGPNGGIPLRVEIVGGDGEPRDRTYTAASNQTVYSQLQELASVAGGPEWTFGWERTVTDGQVFYTPVLYVGDRIGVARPAGLSPAAVYRMPGSLRDFVQQADYGDGKGANYVSAWSSGQGDARPMESYTVPDPNRPTFEYRWSPSSNITEPGTLLSHAQRKGEAMANGGQALTLVADYDAVPRLGVDWRIGDDIGYAVGGRTSGPRQVVVTGDAFTEWAEETPGAAAVSTQVQSWEMVPAFPGGVRGVVRALGWRLNLGANPTVEPVLAGGEV